MKKHLRKLLVVCCCLLIVTTAQASELEGMVEFLIMFFLGGAALLIGLIFMFVFFIRDLKFISFSFFNILITFILLSLVANGDVFSEQAEFRLTYVLRFQVLLQIIAIVMAILRRNKRKRAEQL